MSESDFLLSEKFFLSEIDFLISETTKNWFSDRRKCTKFRIPANRCLGFKNWDFDTGHLIFWYQKFEFLMSWNNFWYQKQNYKFKFLISEHQLLVSENQFRKLAPNFDVRNFNFWCSSEDCVVVDKVYGECSPMIFRQTNRRPWEKFKFH